MALVPSFTCEHLESPVGSKVFVRDMEQHANTQDVLNSPLKTVSMISEDYALRMMSNTHQTKTGRIGFCGSIYTQY